MLGAAVLRCEELRGACRKGNDPSESREHPRDQQIHPAGSKRTAPAGRRRRGGGEVGGKGEGRVAGRRVGAPWASCARARRRTTTARMGCRVWGFISCRRSAAGSCYRRRRSSKRGSRSCSSSSGGRRADCRTPWPTRPYPVWTPRLTHTPHAGGDFRRLRPTTGSCRGREQRSEVAGDEGLARAQPTAAGLPPACVPPETPDCTSLTLRAL